MPQRIDENEHSMELHTPFIKRAFLNHDVKLVPIMVGSISNKKEQEFGQKLAPFLCDEETLFIVSSDFCHWGANFDYYPHDKSAGAVWQSVEKMDREGMQLIEAHDEQGFAQYLQRTENTICGQHPISVFLNAVVQSGLKLKTEFTAYAQSEKAKTKRDSSVSYASSITYLV